MSLAPDAALLCGAGEARDFGRTFGNAMFSSKLEELMNILQEIEQLLAMAARAEKARVLQWIVRDLGDAFPGIESIQNVCGSERWSSQTNGRTARHRKAGRQPFLYIRHLEQYENTLRRAMYADADLFDDRDKAPTARTFSCAT